ncbi:MAG TPA: Do family serine endopeptidase [Xanthobacteraceae bacterium]|jgi:serine protease Do|nr:Do family serine endopeptidase [Xanthobacteraceae bacterium]
MFMRVARDAGHRLFSKRRIFLLASVAGLSSGFLFADFSLSPHKSGSALFAPPYAHAQDAQRPVGFADIVEKVKPAVISVKVKMNAPSDTFSLNEDNPLRGTPFEDFFRRFGQDIPRFGERQRPQRRQYTLGQGSGFFISADGYAVTNNHVVDKAEHVDVTTDDGKTYTAKVIGTDDRTDLALIKVEGRRDFPFVRLADKQPRIGDWVLAVGNPFGLGGTVTAGIVSARGRDIGAGPYDDFIQIDAAVNKGNSGGPTFDLDGNVIGVNTAIFSPSGGSVGIAFDIPAETVKSVITQLKDHGAVTRGWIGVQIQPVTSEIADSLGLKNARGALVAEPQPGSPAQKAGIKAGDVIVSVNGETVTDARNLARRISAMAPGTSVKLGIIRSGREDTLTLTLGELPKERQARVDTEDRPSSRSVDIPKLGLSLAPSRNGEGVMVTQVDPNGSASDQFQSGDVILDVNGKAVSTPADVRRAVSEAQSDGKRSVLMRVKSGQGTHFVAVAIGNA